MALVKGEHVNNDYTEDQFNNNKEVFISIQSSNVTMDNLVFKNNQILKNEEYDYSAIYIEEGQANLTILNSLFENLKSKNGPAINAGDGSFNIEV